MSGTATERGGSGSTLLISRPPPKRPATVVTTSLATSSCPLLERNHLRPSTTSGACSINLRPFPRSVHTRTCVARPGRTSQSFVACCASRAPNDMGPRRRRRARYKAAELPRQAVDSSSASVRRAQPPPSWSIVGAAGGLHSVHSGCERQGSRGPMPDVESCARPQRTGARISCHRLAVRASLRAELETAATPHVRTGGAAGRPITGGARQQPSKATPNRHACVWRAEQLIAPCGAAAAGPRPGRVRASRGRVRNAGEPTLV